VPRDAHDRCAGRPDWPARYQVDSVLLNFGSYPLSIFGFVAQWAMTWILPVAFTAWVTARVRIRVQRLALTADVVVALAELRVSSGLRMPDCCVLLAAHATGGTVATLDHRLADASRALGFDTTS
jgi:predicted nucleic acid-binding protein